jgi:hypothetical protein
LSKLETIYSTKSHEFGIKTVELYESSTKFLLNFTVYAVANCDITTSTNVPDSLQHLKIVVKLVEPLVNLGYALWIDSHYNFTSPCSLLRDDWVSVADTLHLNTEHVLQLVKSKKLTKGESVTVECNRFMVVKWRDKCHSYQCSMRDTMQTQRIRGIHV